MTSSAVPADWRPAVMREDGRQVIGFRGKQIRSAVGEFTDVDTMLAEAALSLGLYISFSGVLTFKNSQALRDIARAVPMDRVLVETDAPYLAPVPQRGKRNEPAFMAETARRLAEVRGVAPEHIARVTTGNFDRLMLN